MGHVPLFANTSFAQFSQVSRFLCVVMSAGCVVQLVVCVLSWVQPLGHMGVVLWSHGCGPLVTWVWSSGHMGVVLWSHGCGPLVTWVWSSGHMGVVLWSHGCGPLVT